MKGSIFFQKDRNKWAVSFYYQNRTFTITRYKNEFMYDRRIAKKCLAVIQSDYENFLNGLGSFRIEKYIGKGFTDVCEFFEKWLVLKEKKKPATVKGYKSYYRCWIKPFFEKYPVMLHEINLDVLYNMMDFMDKLSGKSKYNIMNCFHHFMTYAWRSRRIPEMIPFPEKGDYNIEEPVIQWLHETDQLKVINCIPKEEQPIFLWMKYHYRRNCEAYALQWRDYDEINNVFVIRRSISARQIVGSTKTGDIYYVPCHENFIPCMIELKKHYSGNPMDFIFQNPRARKPGSRYSDDTINRIWKKACKKAGVKNIGVYKSMKHSTCTQYINEYGGTVDELQMLTGHKKRESVLRYAKIEVERKRRLMNRSSSKVIRLADYK